MTKRNKKRGRSGSRGSKSRKRFVRPLAKSSNPDRTTVALGAVDAFFRDRRTKYELFVEANRRKPSLERAQAWLQFVAADPEDYGDQEALIYLVSRGFEVTRLVDATVEQWKQDEERAIANSLSGRPITDLRTGATRYINALPRAEVEDIENASEYLLREFWHAHRSQIYSLDATMLRTVEWCGIGGFEPWWRRLARITEENTIQAGIEPEPAIYYLFNMVRSHFAMRLMPRPLGRMLEACELVHRGNPPWLSLRPFPGKGGRTEYKPIHNLEYAAALIFASHQLKRRELSSPLLHQAISFVQRGQNRDGSWPAWLEDHDSSVEATAISIHALAIAGATGWERQARRAVNSLLQTQSEGGYWVEEASPDPVYLTVLTLDAISLARGEDAVTFEVPAHGPSKKDPYSPKRYRYRVAVSFPGEIRDAVESVVRILQDELGRECVFYDKDFAHELARTDLDLRLQHVYHDESELVVDFLAADYANKEWCGLEWRGIRDLIKTGRGNDIMFLRLKNAPLPPGMLSLDGFVDISNLSAEEVAGLIHKRLKTGPK